MVRGINTPVIDPLCSGWSRCLNGGFEAVEKCRIVLFSDVVDVPQSGLTDLFPDLRCLTTQCLDCQ